jgi:3-phenylpropionate/cinnamic acid dioxygenase small subunit
MKSGRQPAPADAQLDYLILMREIEDFLYREADLLDEREFLAWLELLTDDVSYWMPMRKNLAFSDLAREMTGEDDIAWLHDDKETLTKRVQQLLTGVHWIEEPMSRVTHMVSNIRLQNPLISIGEGESFTVTSRFLVYRNRLETETDVFVGRRHDTLRREGGALKIAGRKIIIEQNVLLAKTLTVFF